MSRRPRSLSTTASESGERSRKSRRLLSPGSVDSDSLLSELSDDFDLPTNPRAIPKLPDLVAAENQETALFTLERWTRTMNVFQYDAPELLAKVRKSFYSIFLS